MGSRTLEAVSKMQPGDAKAGATGRMFPVVHSVFAANAVQAIVLQVYRIAAPANCYLIRRGFHDTYLITTAGDRYIARLYRAFGRTPGEVAYELDLLNYLESRDVSVSAPVITRQGSLSHPVTAPEGPRQLALFTYANGTGLAWEKEEHSYYAGRLLAAIHAASQDFVSRHARSSLDLEYLVDSPLRALRPFLVDRPDDWRCLKECGARLRTRVEAAISQGLEWGVCHGDFVGNIHITKDLQATAFDFDFCGPGWRAFDFIAPYGFAKGWNKTVIWRSFIKGYTETRPFSRADQASVPLFRAIGRLWSAGVRAGNVDHRGTLRMTGGELDHILEFFRKWEAEDDDAI
jgi:Ser/Thr protein kinase RdoA (MazF antagonist)